MGIGHVSALKKNLTGGSREISSEKKARNVWQ